MTTASAGAPLVLYGQRSESPVVSGCPDAVKWARLRAPDGTWIPLTCGRRSCPYCGRLRDYELLQCLLIDAREQLAGGMLTTTTVDPFRPGLKHRLLDCKCPRCLASSYRDACHLMWRELRSHFGRLEYLASMEFTTGERAQDGQRRMHGHHLVKWLDPASCADAQAIARTVWERETGAWNVQVAPLRSSGGIAGYLALHHRKRDQLPPKEWRGMTVRASKGFWSRPIAEIRAQAKQEQAIRRAQWRLREGGMAEEAALLLGRLVAEHQAEQWAQHTPELVMVRQHPGGLVTPVNVR